MMRLDRKTLLFVWFPLLLLVPLACGCRTPSSGSGEIRLALGYVPNVQFTPYYVALDHGYFAAAGLQVRLEYLAELDILKLLARGHYDFAGTDGDSVILGRIQGLAVRYVLTQYVQYPVGLIVPRSSKISHLKDLVGKRIGIPEFFGSSYIGLKALLFEAGLSESDFQIQAIGYTQVSTLSEGRADAVMGYLANEPVLLENRGFRVDVLPVSRAANLVGPGLVTSEKMLRERKEAAAQFAAALLRGLRQTLMDPEHAFQVALRHIPDLQGEDNIRIQRQVLERVLSLWRSTGELGRSSEDRWSDSQELLFRAGLITRRLPPAEFFTNELVDRAAQLP